MIEKISKKLNENKIALKRYINEQASRAPAPIYSSFDLRCNGTKAAAVDANVFPAGFNNICPQGTRLAASLLQQILYKRLGSQISTIGIYAEAHTKNKFYLQNLHSLEALLLEAGFTCRLTTTNPDFDDQPRELETAKGDRVKLYPLQKKQEELYAAGDKLDMVISNNDFSAGLPEIFEEIQTPVLPPVVMGWYNRSKFTHHQKQQQVTEKVADILDIDPWYLSAQTEQVQKVDFSSGDGFSQIAATIDRVVEQTEQRYAELNVDEPVCAFVKAARGTYGMNVYKFDSGEQFLEINRSRRDSLDKRKGGIKNNSVLVQEGIRTKDRVEGLVAEPVIYCLEQEPIGGFLRTNDQQGECENLNARGMNFTSENLCPLFIDQADKNVGSNLSQPQVEVYKLLATIGTLACGLEIKDL